MCAVVLAVASTNQPLDERRLLFRLRRPAARSL
jgi:hypothetical protein